MVTVRSSGFTLVELLVSIGIIVLLAALLVPALFGARSSGRQTSCTANERQLALAMRLYVGDHDSTYPPGPLIGDLLAPYLGKGTQGVACPDATPAPPMAYADQIRGYAVNIALTSRLALASGETEQVSDARVPYPSTTVLACDEAIGVPLTAGPDPYHFGGARPEGQERGWLRHRLGANYVFCDQHAKWYAPEAVGYNTSEFPNRGVSPTFALSDTFD